MRFDDNFTVSRASTSGMQKHAFVYLKRSIKESIFISMQEQRIRGMTISNYETGERFRRANSSYQEIFGIDRNITAEKK